MDARLVTTNDLYAFDPKRRGLDDEFTDIIGRTSSSRRKSRRDNTP